MMVMRRERSPTHTDTAVPLNSLVLSLIRLAHISPDMPESPGAAARGWGGSEVRVAGRTS